MTDKHHEKYVQIGLNMLHYRKLLKITQQRLADEAGYSLQHIQGVETATSIPSVDALFDIADALKVPIEKLFEQK